MPRKRIPHEVDDAKIEENAQGRPELIPFAKTLNSLLNEMGIHQEDMAQALGIASGSISAYRNGKKEPRLFMIVKMADYLGVDCHYLMTGIQAKNRVSSKELGLSEKAVNAIKASRGWGMDVLNCFLENPDFSNFLLEVRRVAAEERRLKIAEAALIETGDDRFAGDVAELTEKRDVRAYWVTKNFDKLLSTTIGELISHKEFQKSVDMVDRAVKKEFNGQEAENHGEH